MFMLDLLDNLPRLRLSDDHLKAIIWVMKECGTPNVPSFYALRKMQAKLTRANQFYMNHPNDLIRLDFANPLVRKFIHVYPEVTTTVSEFWQAAKYVEEIDLAEFSPMWANWEVSPHRHFYIRELAQCTNHKYVLPVKWIVYKDAIHADAYEVSQEPDHTIIRILATDLQYNFLDIQAQREIIFSETRSALEPYSPHPIRHTAKGRPVFVLRIMPWADDVSGNRSKQYNTHMNMYLANVNIPHKLLAQEYFVWFCATSPHVSSLELFDALSTDCKGDNWTTACDCELKQEILFQIHAHLLPADNPQQAESASTAGSSSTFWCRPGKPQTPQETIARITKQIKTACLGVESAIEALQTETGQEVFNRSTRDPRLNDNRIKGPEREEIKQAIITKIQDELFAWALNEDPCEILHTYLLGEDKYVWHETTKAWNNVQGELFAARLQSASFDRLNMSPLWASYMVQKHFKGLQQLAVFQLDETLCSPAVFELWKVNRVLGALLWYPEIKNMDEYLADISVAIDNVLDRWAVVKPTRITVKYKLHVLSHIPDACWNAVFRLFSVLSNHQAPNLDIAMTLADMERFKHQVSGGWWKPDDEDEWTQAGLRIRNFLTGNKQLQRRLGWTPPDLLKPGTVKKLSKAKRKSGVWNTILHLQWKEKIIEGLPQLSETIWDDCKYAVARSEDLCFVNSWVFFHRGCRGTYIYRDLRRFNTIAGSIAKILVPESSILESGAVVIVEHFDISNSNDECLDMPLLIRTTKNYSVQPKVPISCSNSTYNMTVRIFSCPLVDVTGGNQERQASKITRKMKAHSDDSRFHINLHALRAAPVVPL
ncbi:hypothetical protein B0H14DRAFT_3093282 [Mycena olivaceomarginata]|nr:hypothetical protein B0H14DRAFT_3093282 [Mycena olivaceomarginata]